MDKPFALQRVARKGPAEPPGRADLRYWLSRPPEERIAAVEYLRRQYHASTSRLQKVARVVQRARG